MIHHYVRSRLLGNIFTLATTDTLTLLDSQTNHFSQKKKERKEMEASDLHAFLGQSIVTLACQLLRMFRVIHVWWQNTASLTLTTTTLTTTGSIVMGQTADETFLGVARAVHQIQQKSPQVNIQSWMWIRGGFYSKSSKCQSINIHGYIQQILGYL